MEDVFVCQSVWSDNENDMSLGKKIVMWWVLAHLLTTSFQTGFLMMMKNSLMQIFFTSMKTLTLT